MRRPLAILLVAVMSMGAMTATMVPAGPTILEAGQDLDTAGTGAVQYEVMPPARDAPNASQEDKPKTPPTVPNARAEPVPGEPLPVDNAKIGFPTYVEIILLYRNPTGNGEWIPLPTQEDLDEGTVTPATFANGTQLEIHGRLYEKMVNLEEYSYLNATGLPNMSLRAEFAGELVPGGVINTGNDTTSIEPFAEHGNGTFEFILDINKPAAQYFIEVKFEGYPQPPQIVIYQPLTHRAVVFVSHPTLIRLDDLPASVVVGKTLSVSGSLRDDTGITVSSVPLRVMFDDTLLGPASDGLYIDDVEVTGTDFTEDFEGEGAAGWMAYAVAGSDAPNQWEHGPPGEGFGPPAATSGTQLWGSVLDGLYDRGARSFLVSPRLDLSACSTCGLSFWAWWSLYWEDDVGYVMCSVDDGQTWDEANASFFTRERLASDGWEEVRLDLTGCGGSDEVRVAFVFYSADKTLDVRTDGTYTYNYTVPMDTTADVHRLTVEFRGNLLFRPGIGCKDVRVMRIVHFEFEQDPGAKVGHRNEPINLVAWLVDNEGEVPKTSIAGVPYVYVAAAYWGGWSYTHPPLPPERTGRVDPETGKVTIDYVVAWDQALGPEDVTFRFGGSDYYTPAEDTDVYFVKAHTYVKVPPEQERRVYRRQSLDIHGELRIVPGESIEDTELGDFIPGEFVSIYWGYEPLGAKRTFFDGGSFGVGYVIPRTHPLGDVIVCFLYKGSSFYENVTVFTTYTVASTTTIELYGVTVWKGTPTWINGTIKDDQGAPIPDMTITIIWSRQPELGRVLSDGEGRFSLHHIVEYDSMSSNVTVSARCAGGHIYDASEGNATFKVMVGTIIQRRDRVLSVMRGDRAEFACKLYEDWGGSRGVEVQRQAVLLYVNDVLVGVRQTAFDGTITLTVPFDPMVFMPGDVPLEFLFNGTEFLGPSRNESTLTLEGDIEVSFMNLRANGLPLDSLTGIVKWNDTLHGQVNVRDTLVGSFANRTITMAYVLDAPNEQMHVIASGRLDRYGTFEFEGRLTSNRSGTMLLLAVVEGMPLELYRGVDGEVSQWYTGKLSLRYLVPPPLSDPSTLRTRGDRSVAVGDRLELRVDARYIDEGPDERLSYSLVSPPEGMEISDDGVITWKPTKDQVGEHSVTVWFYDDDHSTAAIVEVTVTGEHPGPKGSVLVVIVVIVVCAAIALLQVARARHARNREGPRD